MSSGNQPPLNSSQQHVNHNDQGVAINTINGDVHITSPRATITSFFRKFQSKTILGWTGLFVGCLALAPLALPRIALAFNEQGLQYYRQDKLQQAQRNFKIGTALSPWTPEPHYNLGLVYEDLLKWDKAKQAYQKAVERGLPEAYNNLARLHIKEGNYKSAVSLLNSLLEKGLPLTQKSKIYPEDMYNIYKNLGWARLEQGRNEDAQNVLLKAISISKQRNVRDYIPNPASAHCLLAQVLENQQQKNKAIPHWQECADNSQNVTLEEDNWQHLARQHLDNQFSPEEQL